MSKATRKIVKIDEDKCDGCGVCVPACAEGAIKVINGKARLVAEVYCDGLGACLGDCPRDAITIEERPAEAFDEKAVEAHLAATRPAEQAAPPASVGGGCPGSAMRNLNAAKPAPAADTDDDMPPSQLGHWPVQLQLIPPSAPFLQGTHLVICADCAPFVVADLHSRYLTGRSVLIGCPKLDDLEEYREKFRQLFAVAQLKSLTVLRMEVPCCAGLAHAAVEARNEVAPTLPTEVHTLGIRGGVEKQVVPAE